MATLSDAGYPNITDVLRRLDPTGATLDLAELLDQELDFLEDVPMVEANGTSGHSLGDRTALPSVSAAWRRFNAGVPATKSRSAQFTEVCGMLEAWANIDDDEAQLANNPNAFRESESKAHIESVAQEFARSLWYESVLDNPEKVHGLSARYAATTGYTASSYVQMIGSTSTTGCQSIWLINWSPDTIFSIYPKGSRAGLFQEDLGRRVVRDSNGYEYMALSEHFQWKLGFAVKDYRHAVRAQWDTDDATYVADSHKTLYLGMQRMMGTIKKVTSTTRFYMTRTSFNKLMAQLASNSADYLKWVTAGGRPIPNFLGIPIRITDSLVSESAYA